MVHLDSCCTGSCKTGLPCLIASLCHYLVDLLLCKGNLVAQW